MKNSMYGRGDLRLLQLLLMVLVLSFALGWGGIRSGERFLIKKEAEELVTLWTRTIFENFGNMERLLATGQHTEHDRVLLSVTTGVTGLIDYKIYNGEGRVVMAASSGDINRKNEADFFMDHVRRGVPHVIATETEQGDKQPRFVTEAYIPIMGDAGFMGAVAATVDSSASARHVREIGNYAIGGLSLILMVVGAVCGWLLIRDFAFRKAQHESLRRARAKAEAADLAKSEFLAGISHEIRTPLNAINGFSEVIADEMFGPIGLERYKEYGQDIHDSGELLLALINDVLDLSKVAAGKFDLHEEVLNLPEIVDKGIRLVSDRAQKNGVKISWEPPLDLPVLRADGRIVLQVLLNLLSNAVKFTPSGGVVNVMAFVEQGGSLVLYVRDTGIGIARDDIPKVLEPFGQVGSRHHREEGTGLGLPLAKRFIEQHGGHFFLASKEGIGTTVLATFPQSRLVPALHDH